MHAPPLCSRKDLLRSSIPRSKSLMVKLAGRSSTRLSMRDVLMCSREIGRGYWDMGTYQFKVELMDDDQAVDTAEATFDPMSVCQRDYYGPIFSTYPQQFIECSPVRPAYIDTDEMRFTIRTLPERVAKCTVVADVTARNDEKVLAGPWTIELSGDTHEQEFDSASWPRGEYWIRVRLHKDGKPVGPYLIRKVWKETLPPVEGFVDCESRRSEPANSGELVCVRVS